VQALVMVGVLFVVLPPLLVRGPVLSSIVARETRTLCGTIKIGGGHLGWTVVPDLLLERPFTLELLGVHVAGANGGEVLAAERVSVDVEIERLPWRITVGPGVVSHGRWRLVVDDTGGVGGFLGVFRPVPAGGATTAACLQPVAPRHGSRPPATTPRAPAAPVAPAAPSASLVLRDIDLDEIDVDLDFPVWGLSLPRAHGTGSLSVGTPEPRGFAFDVRDATSPGGTLRAGPGGSAATAATTTAHFDDVVISRVGVSTDEPGDLVLAVARADTGRSRLSGRAVFENVFPHHGRRGERRQPGLDLDARWERLTDAATRIEAPWLPREALGEVLDGALAARVRGPFRALSGTLSIEGPRAGVEASIDGGEKAALEIRASDLALAPFLHESLLPLLGGRVTGRLRATLALDAGLGNADLEIPSADVTLTREHYAADEPRRVAFRVGIAEHQDADGTAEDTLVLGLTSARLFRRALRLEGMSARWAEISAHGALTLALPAVTADATASVDAHVDFTVSSLARWVAPEMASAHLEARAALTGPLDHLRARLSFSPSTSATLLGQRFRARSTVTASLDDGRALTVAGLVLGREGGGRVEVHGRAETGGPVEGEVHVSGYPLSAIPGVETIELPGMFTTEHPTSLSDALTGTLEGSLKVSGSAARPLFSGTVDLNGVGLAGRPLGDGHFSARSHGWTVALDGVFGSTLALDLEATRSRAGVSGVANLKLTDTDLAPWMPAALAGLEVTASGTARVTVAPSRPLATHAELRFVGPGGDLAVTSASSDTDVEATLLGRLELSGLRPLWKRRLAQADGALSIDVTTKPGAPLTATVVVARALTLRPAGWPLALGVAEGGRVDVDGTRVHVPALTLTADGADVALAGDVHLDLAAPERSLIDLTAKARVDAGALARRARLPALASAGGTISVDARATGEARAPDVIGTARLSDVELRPTSKAWPTLRVNGVVAASGHVLSTRDLRVETVGDRGVPGTVTVGAPDAPATVTLSSTWPTRVERVDAPVSARGLQLGDAKSSFAIGALDLQLRLRGDPARELVLSGDVGVAGARLNPFGGKKRASSGPARPWFESLPPRLTLDLTLHGPDDALVIDVPVLPDLDLGFHCRAAGNTRGGTISGRLRGRGLYSRVMLALFAPAGARECRVLKE
jgi:hypothetical protein